MIVKSIEEYLNDDPWMRRENANQVESISKVKGYVADKAMREYTLSKYPEHIREAHENGLIHIHDLSNGIIAYCSGHELLDILTRGLWTPAIVSAPPKHLSSALDQTNTFLTSKQSEWAGAQAVSNVNTLMAPYIRSYCDNLVELGVSHEAAIALRDEYAKQCIQAFIYDCGQQFRRSNETPFINVIFDAKCPKKFAEMMCHLKQYSHLTYADFHEESMLFLRLFNKVMGGGDAEGKPFTFPIPTINVVPDMDWDNPLWLEIAEVDGKYGYYYWMNLDGSGIAPDTVQAMCCRLNIDLSELPPAGGRWAHAGSTGSLGIVSLNMSRLGYISGNEDELYENLGRLLEIAKESLLLKGKWIEDSYDRGLMPITRHYGVNFDRYFRTIGVIGLHEMCVNFNGKPVWENVKLVTSVLNHIREWIKGVQMETGKLWNVEITPGESAATSMAMKDMAVYGSDIFVQGTPEAPYLSTLITPPNHDMPLGERIAYEQEILPLFTGGTVFRVFMDESTPFPLGTLKIIRRIMKHSKIPYLDLASTRSHCSNSECGFNVGGVVEICPQCGSGTLTYQKITGYLRPIQSANLGKIQEFRERKYSHL